MSASYFTLEVNKGKKKATASTSAEGTTKKRPVAEAAGQSDVKKAKSVGKQLSIFTFHISRVVMFNGYLFIVSNMRQARTLSHCFPVSWGNKQFSS